MLATFESILPIFLLIVAGNLMRRAPVIDPNGWRGLEQLGFWFLYPALLFVSIAKADFSQLETGPMLSALVVSVAIMAVGALALWPLLGRRGAVKASEFSTVYQTALRWNGFMALAIAHKLFPPEGAAVVALAMAVIVIPINLASIYVVTRFADRQAEWPTVLRRIAGNPLVLSALAGIAARYLPNGIYGPLDVALELVARAALGMGLVAIGAGLRANDLFSTRLAIWLPVLLKLAIFPVLVTVTALAFGVTGPALTYLALCSAVPTAMNGYLLAREMGGDAPLYAAVVTVQTAVSFFTIPAVLAIIGQLASG